MKQEAIAWHVKLTHDDGHSQKFIFVDTEGKKDPRQVKLAVWHDLFGDLFVRPQLTVTRLGKTVSQNLIDIS